jgi:hypothetical protein
MPIEGTIFGRIAIDAKTYEHDVIIGLPGHVEKRRKKLSKEGGDEDNPVGGRSPMIEFLERQRLERW